MGLNIQFKDLIMSIDIMEYILMRWIEKGIVTLGNVYNGITELEGTQFFCTKKSLLNEWIVLGYVFFVCSFALEMYFLY